ncbi:uncharacterized protein LOC107677489 [Sinocyclocheilus anshuiensis]|uniref:uncharacterized protein LOC107677489 n=1 Tax=Sinocyclocheilus anshuiensis TaxID=1608454 RepID=UPI0007B7CEA4|nr:PREDICTED: uncharacterized protein LOC107677489 [Sinocyclocheilus anshuiensis]
MHCFYVHEYVNMMLTNSAFSFRAILQHYPSALYVLYRPGTPEETRRLIRFRAENEQHFLKYKYNAKQLWETLIKELGLEGKVTGQQASKKWENLKKKYKDLKTPKTGSGTDAGEVTASTWQYFEEMHEVLGSRPSVDPPVVVASFTNEEPITILMDTVEPSGSTAASTIGAFSSLQNTSEETASSSAASTMVIASPPTPSPKKKNPVLDFFVEESQKEQNRHEESEAKTESS